MTRLRVPPYTASVAQERMAEGKCPECGYPVDSHTGRGGPGCTLTDNGVAQQVYDYEQARKALIELCERGIVPEDRWGNRDSAKAQRQLGEAWALLRAGCHFRLSNDPRSDKRTHWIRIRSRGFAYVEGTLDGGPGELDDDLFYIPTAERLIGVDGGDWY